MPNRSKNLARAKKHFPKKSLGQNFLISPHIRNKIIAACQFQPNDIVLEIGPGKGILTKNISPLVKKLIAVEKDRQLTEQLINDYPSDTVEIIQGDILRHSLPKTKQKIILIGNIPYNISTPIVEYAIANRTAIKSFFMTVQLEFARRLTAHPNCKDYGALTCFAQYYADVKLLFKIKNTCFYPVPKVQSAFIRMDFLRKPRYRLQHPEQLFSMIKQTFSKRRKTILNALSGAQNKEHVERVLNELGIDCRLRPENLALDNFVNIFQKLE